MFPFWRIVYPKSKVLARDIGTNVEWANHGGDILVYLKPCRVAFEYLGEIQLLNLFLESAW